MEQQKEANKYSIIIPTYNECLNIALIVYFVFKHLKDVDFEIIVVDDGSPNGTIGVVKQLQQVYEEDYDVSIGIVHVSLSLRASPMSVL
ncbi:hypothetical protein GIB67_019855 [Kingdonia uniflora]|uniref:dolichyl-phosphate beta-D-mannosyltransferase n=1 Tax=Kingdonia uniflora TaxID=39325 RepID=A0A7J7MK94_9MAGN|nr:hypothetical protein GIB67_019855 [Kingdonia uniflora]